MMPKWLEKYQSLDLFNNNYENQPLTFPLVSCTVGNFFEHISSQLLNLNKPIIPSGWPVYPDLIKDNLLFEIKGCNKYNGVVIDKGQCGFYRKLISDQFPFHNAEAYYLIYIYTIDKSCRDYKTVGELIHQLSDSIEGLIILPINIIEQMFFIQSVRSYGFDSQYGKRTTKDGTINGRGIGDHLHYIRFPSVKLCKIILKQISVKEVFPLLKGYNIRRKYMNKDIDMLGYQVTHFPIAAINCPKILKMF